MNREEIFKDKQKGTPEQSAKKTRNAFRGTLDRPCCFGSSHSCAGFDRVTL